jgi:hypothetical protein
MKQPKSMAKDPICGMTVDETTALHAATSKVTGRAMHTDEEWMIRTWSVAFWDL